MATTNTLTELQDLIRSIECGTGHHHITVREYSVLNALKEAVTSIEAAHRLAETVDYWRVPYELRFGPDLDATKF